MGWKIRTADKVAYPPGEYVITVTISIKDNSQESIDSIINLTLIDTCTIPVLIDKLSDQTLYVGGPQVTL